MDGDKNKVNIYDDGSGDPEETEGGNVAEAANTAEVTSTDEVTNTNEVTDSNDSDSEDDFFVSIEKALKKNLAEAREKYRAEAAEEGDSGENDGPDLSSESTDSDGREEEQHIYEEVSEEEQSDFEEIRLDDGESSEKTAKPAEDLKEVSERKSQEYFGEDLGKDSSKSSEEDPPEISGDDSAEGSEEDPEGEIEDNSREEPEENSPEESSEGDSAEESEKDISKKPEEDSAEESEEDTLKEPGEDSKEAAEEEFSEDSEEESAEESAEESTEESAGEEADSAGDDSENEAGLSEEVLQILEEEDRAQSEKTDDTIIDLKNVNMIYANGTVALKDVSLKIRKGEFVFIVGSSGSGKSTLIKTLLGEIHPSSGRIKVDGRDLSTIARKQLPYYRRRVGVVFQEFRLLDDRNVIENVSLAQRVIGMPRERRKRNSIHMLKLVGLDNKMTSRIRDLSGGEQQRVAIARAMVNKPVILLADEPTGNLDPENSWEIMKILEELNKIGTTMLVVTHNDNLVNQMQKRVITLHNGKIINDEEGGYVQ